MNILTLLFLLLVGIPHGLYSNNARAAETPPNMQVSHPPTNSELQKELLSNFITGQEFCKKFDAITKKERGFFITVPIDYENPSAGTTKIYAYFAGGKFDPNLPTALFFDGGPGGNSHGVPKVLSSFNELHFDQRGIGCSRPSSLSLYRDPNFYGSVRTARDANEIRKYLGIHKISVYGVSYGTVPATIFASLFPKNTGALVLEGVLFNARYLDYVGGMRANLMHVYDALPDRTKRAMQAYFTPDKKEALFNTISMLSYGNRSYDKLQNLLLKIFPDIKGTNLSAANQNFAPQLQTNGSEGKGTVNASDTVVNIIITCKELAENHGSVILYYFDKRTKRLILMQPSLPMPSEAPKRYCSALGVKPNPIQYSADRFPVIVPTTYFEGEWDAETKVEGALQHWMRVPKGQSQFLLALKGGHTPNYLASFDYPGNGPIRTRQLVIFEKALKGELVTPDDIDAINAVQKKVHWVLESRANDRPQSNFSDPL